VTLTATPSVDSAFAGWSGGGCTGTGLCVVTLTAATAVTATFTQPIFVLTVSPAGAGTGTVTSSPGGINCGAICSASLVSGTVVALTASPNGGSEFVGWSGGGCSGIAGCTVTLRGPTVVTAMFNVTAPLTFTDPDLEVGFSTIKAVHVLELRNAINSARTRRGLAPFSFTDPDLVAGSTTLKAVHVAELRTALNEVYAREGAPAPIYTDPLSVGVSVAKAVHISELRSAVQAVSSLTR